MRIFLDADAAPAPVKEILFRAAERLSLELVLVANIPLQLPPSPLFSALCTDAGPDAADNKIVELTREGDLVITADIPLADRVISKGAVVITPRGEILTVENICERLAVRDLMADLRDSGIPTGGPAAFSDRDRRNFANQLDAFLTRALKDKA